MTIRDIAVAIGFKIDAGTEAKANSAINKIKQNAASKIENIKVAFKETGAEDIANDIRYIGDQAKGAEHNTDNLGDSIHEVGEETKKTDATAHSLLGTFKKIAEAIGVTFVVNKVKEFASECIGMASDVQEMQNKFDVVFQGMTKEVEEWADSYAEAVGRNSNTIKGYLADEQNMFVGMGMERKQAAGLSEDMTKLALDLASFNNLNETDAVTAMTKALMGETESAKTLGAVLNDNTKAAAMEQMQLKGKFKDLDEATKMQVNYTAIMMQSKDAVGDCERSMGSYESSVRANKAAVEGLKETIGTYILPYMAKIISFGTKYVNGAKDVIKAIAGETDKSNALIDTIKAIRDEIKILEPAVGRVISFVKSGMSTLGNVIKGAVNKLGGIQNVIKILGTVVAAAIAYFAYKKVVDGVGAIAKAVRGLGSAFHIASLKAVLIVAIIALIILAVDDFVNFMKGNDSLLGTLFEKAGINADEVRETIVTAWNAVKDFLKSAWDVIKSMGEMTFGAIADFFSRHSESIRQNFERAWGIIKTFLEGAWTFISDLASGIFGNTEDNINNSNMSTKDKILSVWQSILDALSTIWDAIYNVSSSVFNALANVIESIFSALQAFWDAWGSTVVSWFQGIWSNLGGIIDGFLQIITGLANFISAVFSGNWSAAWQSVCDIFSGIWDVIVNVLEGAWNTVVMLIKMGLSAIRAIWNSIWSGICGFFSGIWSRLKGAASAGIHAVQSVINTVLNAIKSFFGNIFGGIKDKVVSIFTNMKSAIGSKVSAVKDTIVNGFKKAISFITSLPKQALTWGKDFIDGLINGIKSKIGAVVDAVKGVGKKIKSFLHFSVPDEGPLTDYETWMPDFMEGLAKGIDKSKGKVIGKVKSLAGDMAVLTKAAVVTPQTVGNTTIGGSTSKTINQNVNINNRYAGTMGEQKTASKAMDKASSDSTSEMARALQYL